MKRKDEDVAQCDPRDERTRNIISSNVRKAIIILAIMTGLFLLGVYTYLTRFTDFSHEQIQTVMFLTVSVDSIFMALSLKRLNKSIFKTNLFNNKWLIGAVSLSIILVVIAFLTPPLAKILSLTAVPLWIFSVVPISGLFHISVIEIIKAVLFKKDFVSPKQKIMRSGAW